MEIKILNDGSVGFFRPTSLEDIDFLYELFSDLNEDERVHLSNFLEEARKLIELNQHEGLILGDRTYCG